MRVIVITDITDCGTTYSRHANGTDSAIYAGWRME
jgi:hypothetical protein